MTWLFFFSELPWQGHESSWRFPASCSLTTIHCCFPMGSWHVRQKVLILILSSWNHALSWKCKRWTVPAKWSCHTCSRRASCFSGESWPFSQEKKKKPWIQYKCLFPMQNTGENRRVENETRLDGSSGEYTTSELFCHPTGKYMVLLILNTIYLCQQSWVEAMFSPLSVCLWAGYHKTLWTDSDKIWWTGWVCDKDKLIRFWWRSGSEYENLLYIVRLFFTIERMGPKTRCSMIFQKCVDRLWQNFGRCVG